MQKRLMNVVLVNGAFSASECNDIMTHLKNVELEPGMTGPEGTGGSRQSNVRFISYDPSLWVFQRLQQVVDTVNTSFRFDLNPFFDEGFQYTQYPEGGYYDWHTDIGGGPSEDRKLSLVLLLNDDYEGGELQFFPARFDIPKKQGTLAVFPSFMTHRVAKVLKGTRYSLVTWVSGPKAFA